MESEAGAERKPSPGALLRAAREQQGMHIATLAAAIKVAPRKLDALENDRWDELPGPTFTRALAQAVCRVLKTDPRPVLVLLPPADTSMLDSTVGNLNEPFAGRPGAESSWQAWRPRGPVLLAALLLLLAAVALWAWPAGWLSRLSEQAPLLRRAASDAGVGTGGAGGMAAPAAGPAGAGAPLVVPAFGPAASAAEGVSMSPLPASAPGLSVTVGNAAVPPTAAASAAIPPPPAASAGTAAAAAAAPAGALVVRSTEPSWVEVRDAADRVLASRHVTPDEPLGVDGRAPLQVVVGNAAATQVSYRGQAVDLSSRTRDNVARLELR